MPSAPAKGLEAIAKKLEKGASVPGFQTPLEWLIFIIIFESGNAPQDIEKAMKRVLGYFVDWNEARVSRWVEIARAFDPLPFADAAAIRTRDMLHRLFDLRGELSLDFFADMKITEARKAIGEIEPKLCKDWQVAVLFHCMPEMTPPVTPELLAVARELEVVGRSGSKEQLQKLLTSENEHGAAARIFYMLQLQHALSTRQSAESAKKSSTRKKVAKK